jgi:hypothetical protein
LLSSPIVDLSLLTDFIPFGAEISAGVKNPTYELYSEQTTVPVRAASPGTVVAVFANPAPQTDLELHIRPTSNSAYLVVYDHVLSPQVQVGSVVTAGQTLGTIGPFSDPARNRNARVELQVNNGTGAMAFAVCPRSLGTAAFNAAHDAALARFPARGTTTCLVDTVRP